MDKPYVYPDLEDILEDLLRDITVNAETQAHIIYALRQAFDRGWVKASQSRER